MSENFQNVAFWHYVMKTNETLVWFKIRLNEKQKEPDSQYNSGENIIPVISCVKTLTLIMKIIVTVISARPTERSNLNHTLLLSWIDGDRIFCIAHFKMFWVEFLKYVWWHNKNNHTFHIFETYIFRYKLIFGMILLMEVSG